MEPKYQRIAAYFFVIAVLIGIGFLIYRFIQQPRSTTAKTLVINKEGKFTTDQLELDNDEVFRIQNNDDTNHTVKKSPSNETLAEVDAESTSRELTLDDNSRTILYLASDESETTVIVIGTPSEEREEPEPPTAEEPGQTQGTNNQTNLPETGPESIYLLPLLAIAGAALVKLSNCLYKR